MDYLFPPETVAAIGVVGKPGLFPVRRIYCVGHNYAAHIREVGRDPERELPFFFNKPGDAIVADGGVIPYPTATMNLQFEVELVIAIGHPGIDISAERAREHIFGYAVGVDLTRRDLQQVAEDKSLPWAAAKAFDRSAPCSRITLREECSDMSKGRIASSINDQPQQTGDLSDMIWSVEDIVAYLSRLFELKAGDLIFTGTPGGVGPARAGDRLEATIEGLAPLRVTIGEPD